MIPLSVFQILAILFQNSCGTHILSAHSSNPGCSLAAECLPSVGKARVCSPASQESKERRVNQVRLLTPVTTSKSE